MATIGNHSAFAEVFSGLGLGLLVGVIVGLSVSPVVVIILGSLVSLLAAFLGIQEEESAKAASEKLLSRFKMNRLRTGSLGFACVGGILLGLFIRSHELFSVPVKEQMEKWTSAGYTKEEARQLVAFQKLGIKPEAREVIAGETQKAYSSSLFSNSIDASLCEDLAMEKYGNDASKVLAAYRRTNNAKLARLADQIENHVPAERRGAIIQAIWEVICDSKTQP